MFATNESVPLVQTVLASGVTAAVVAGVVSLITMGVTGHRARQDRQRQVFADAFAACVEYREFAYRVRRRRNDAADEVARISDAMSEVQARLSSLEARVRVEDRAVGEAYSELVRQTREIAGAQIRSGWESPPIPPSKTGRIDDVTFEPLAPVENSYLAKVREHLR
jgi:predicted negative regulator of RcsB-dependent stress response